MEPRDDMSSNADERARAERGRELIAAALADPQTLAPPSVRAAIEQRTRSSAAAASSAPCRVGRLRGRLALAGGALAAGIVAVGLSLGGGDRGPRDPSIVRVAAVARLPATAPAPAVVRGTAPARLDVAVEGLAFPDWNARYAWRATGRRTDRVSGRAVTTVFYRNAKGATLGYSIVAGDSIGGAPAGDDVVAGTRTYRVARGARRTTVAWTQAGHTCVIDAPASVPGGKLLELASWANV